ncbi:hypothetical protein AAG906_030997 [Vitis piasezkii]
MSFLVSKPRPSSSDYEKITHSDDREDSDTLPTVTSYLHLKPAQSSQTLDKDLVLRRIRHRKRVNKVRNLFQTLVSSPFSTTDSVRVQEKKWVDDAFAAP